MTSLLRLLTRSALAVVILLPFLTMAPARASSPSIALTITGATISSAKDPVTGQSQDTVTLAGTLKNTGGSSLTEQLQLVTGHPFATRSQLADVIDTHSSTSVSPVASATTSIANLTAQASAQWSISIPTTKLWSNTSGGVFPIGVTATTSRVSEVIALAWFAKSSSLSPTTVVLAVPITTSTHDVREDVRATTSSIEAERIRQILAANLTGASYVVDGYTTSLLTSSTDEATREMGQELESLGAIPSAFGNVNLARLVAGNQTTSIKRALSKDPTAAHTLYFLDTKTGAIGSFGTDFDKQVVTVVDNTFLSRDKNVTTDARSTSSTGQVLINDSGASSCLSLVDGFSAGWCLNAQLSMMTAESPNASRTVLVSTPKNWDPSLTFAQLVNEQVQGNRAYTLSSLSSLLSAHAVSTVSNQGTRAQPFNMQTRKIERDIVKSESLVRNVFGSSANTSALTAASTVLYSQDWTSESSAQHFGRSFVEQEVSQLNELALEGSKHITIPGTTAQLPVTVFNPTDFTATVNVVVTSSVPGHLTAGKVDTITIEPKRRITVQIPIALHISGDVQAQVSLADSTGNIFGDKLIVEIASTAYQQFARSLVWIALIALVLLVAHNVWRRTRGSQTT